jgi:SAM-dependent methyltransferase
VGHVKYRLFNAKARPIKHFNGYKQYFEGKSGIEIGGPSAIFSKEVPVYPLLKQLDGCNFSKQTIWQGNIAEGDDYNFFGNKKGKQYIGEASDLRNVASEQYDFLLASHCLEHCANTFQTVLEWKRVVKKGGALLLVLPDRRFTFDNKRPVTRFDHLVADFDNNVDETDLTHLDEIASLHDLSKDRAAGTPDEFRARSADNFNNRCLHHHVFDLDLLRRIFEYHGIKVMDTSFAKPYHEIILGVKQ